MPSRPRRLLDPELVIPSATNATTLEFWQRMNVWAVDSEPRIGPSTMQALGELAANPPKVEGLPEGDFWTILSKYMSRGLVSSSVPRCVCEEHLSTSYRAQMGAVDNVERLLADIRAVDADGSLAISTIQSCWDSSGVRTCLHCVDARLSKIYEPISRGGRSNELAGVWRDAYRVEHPSDWTRFEKHATDLFPAIEFSQDAWGKLNTLIGAPEETVTSVMNHLAALNDSAEQIWKHDITPQGREAALGARGVTASLESPSTHKNKKAMRKRDFQFARGVVRCEWHTKLRPETNRIYFAVEEDKVLVGLIVDHLPT